MCFGLGGDRVSSLPLVNPLLLKSYSVLVHLAERAARRAQWEASTGNVGAERFQGTWVVWFLERQARVGGGAGLGTCEDDSELGSLWVDG